MTAAARRWAAELLHFWFHDLREAQWWEANEALDNELRRRFGAELSALAVRAASEFLGDRTTAQAAILLFDQVPRNVHRKSQQAFAYDPLARNIARGVLARLWDRLVPQRERAFLYMPFEHSEAIADQRLSLRLLAPLGHESFTFARTHHRMIARFGRFPHRNAVLGRKSSPDEKEAVSAGFSW